MAIRSKGSVRSLLVTVTACAAALIGVLQVASPAEGAGSTPLKYVSKNKAVPSDETVGVTTGHVTCPADHPLVTKHHIAQVGPARGAWFRDPDGNMLGLRQG